MKKYHYCGAWVVSDEHNPGYHSSLHQRYYRYYPDYNKKRAIPACPNCGANLRVAEAFGDLRYLGDEKNIGEALKRWQKARKRLAKQGLLEPRDPNRVTSWGYPRLLPREVDPKALEDGDPL